MKGGFFLYNKRQQLVLLNVLSMSYTDQVNYLRLVKNLDLEEEISWSDLWRLIHRISSHNYAISYKDRAIFDHYLTYLNENYFMIGDSIYPKLWLEIEQPPLLIYFQGHLELLTKPCISIIGTRRMTDYGRYVTEEIVKACTRQNWVCVSGLAKGVDTCVHQTSITSGSATTIAILPNGLNHYYPRENTSLQQKLAQNQLVLSEYPMDQGVRKHQFILRNRLVAGLSPVTILIESAKRSGSLITANYALQFNREVRVVPGRMTDPYSSGCNDLIEAGAQIISSIPSLIKDIQELFHLQKYG